MGTTGKTILSRSLDHDDAEDEGSDSTLNTMEARHPISIASQRFSASLFQSLHLVRVVVLVSLVLQIMSEFPRKKKTAV